MKKVIILISLLILLSGCTVDDSSYTEYEEQTEQHTGKCLEYTTEYKLDCGMFTCSDSFCCERKYDTCIRWEE